MAPPRRYWVKLTVSSSFLSNLPHFPTPISKSRLKKIAAEERRTSGNGPTSSNNVSKTSSPTPSATNENTSTANTLADASGNSSAAISNFRINSGLKESSTSGLTMNSINNSLYALDKTGKATRKWIKKPTQFKTFSGFKIKYVTYRHKEQARKDSKTSATVPSVKEEKVDKNSVIENKITA